MRLSEHCRARRTWARNSTMNLEYDRLKYGRRLLRSISIFGMLSACAPQFESRYQGPPQLIKRSIEQYYRRHASEDGGRCTRPFIDAITKVSVIEDVPERWVAEVRYRYQDRLRDEDPGTDRKICRGFSSRTFILMPKDGDLVVADMSGQTCRGTLFSLGGVLGLEKGERTCP